MRLLLDTHLLVWIASDPAKLSRLLRQLVQDPVNELFFSTAALWEIIVKSALGQRSFHCDPYALRAGLLANGYKELPITGDHAFVLLTLPPLHRDPFDRIMIAQAIFEGMKLLTVDEKVLLYPGPVQKV
jgi:PIN domain nuclease of toxin-antitoxin system